ncbi:hypothetical protein GWI33_020056 [Rhynchophorus ferrugineus]|uniref:Cyclase n=1 Tax=Rhynchophorus ferrugineus TaxID=354439 RepID=A0A834I3Z0_RHYFE|nr:hypothetical protein GWI33_020056 [Rhynchophorus ferrugineus]
MRTFIFAFIGFIFLLFHANCSSSQTIIDLTWNFNNETIYWPGQRQFQITKATESEKRGFWYSVKEFCAAEHGGTHFDAPYHFYKEGWKVSEVPVDRLFAKGALIETNQSNLYAKDLIKWEESNGRFDNGTVLLVKTGMGKYWTSNKTKYLALDTQNRMNFPGLSADAALWIAQSGQFFGVGIDTPSIDPGNSTDMVAHRTLASGQLFNLENVNLQEIHLRKGFDIIIAPMKLEEGTGAPVRIFAILKIS